MSMDVEALNEIAGDVGVKAHVSMIIENVLEAC